MHLLKLLSQFMIFSEAFLQSSLPRQVRGDIDTSVLATSKQAMIGRFAVVSLKKEYGQLVQYGRFQGEYSTHASHHSKRNMVVDQWIRSNHHRSEGPDSNMDAFVYSAAR
jgi:hypothetical protein